MVAVRTPGPCRMVMYHHPEDQRDWPAMILDVGDDVQINDEGDIGPECYLQVFRPRAPEWKRAVEGPRPGNWEWPEMKSPSNHEIALPQIEA
jgi:hypothetical protein